MIRNLISNAIKFTDKNGKVQVTTEIVEIYDDSKNGSTYGNNIELRRMKACRNSSQSKLLLRRLSQLKVLPGLDTDADADSVVGQLQLSKDPKRASRTHLNQEMLVLKVTDSGAGISAVSHLLNSFTHHSFFHSFVINYIIHTYIL